MKNSNDTTGNQTRVLPVCSTVPLPTAPPRAPTPFEVLLADSTVSIAGIQT